MLDSISFRTGFPSQVQSIVHLLPPPPTQSALPSPVITGFIGKPSPQTPLPQRISGKLGTKSKPLCHEDTHGKVNPCFRGLGTAFVIFTKPTITP